VTKHLVILEGGETRCYRMAWSREVDYLNPVPLHEIDERWIRKYERHRLQALSDLKKGLEKNKKGK